MTQLLLIVQKIVFINEKKKGGLEFFFMYLCSLRKKREERECEKRCIHKIALNFRTMRMMRKTFQMLRAESLNNV